MFKSEIAFDNQAYFARLGANYTDKRYYTYLNDNSVDAYTVFNLGVGYHQKTLGGFKEVSVQLNVNNLFDKHYISTIGSNGFVTSDPNGTNQTLLTGAPRQAFLTVSAKL
jgi:iron complex outermembrane receptor protein